MSIFHDMAESRRAGWEAHPKWAKVYLYAVGVPAWLYLASDMIFGNPFDFSTSDMIACGLFGSAAVVQIAVLFRAAWRMHI